jgi:hypothetical protein
MKHPRSCLESAFEICMIKYWYKIRDINLVTLVLLETYRGVKNQAHCQGGPVVFLHLYGATDSTPICTQVKTVRKQLQTNLNLPKLRADSRVPEPTTDCH